METLIGLCLVLLGIALAAFFGLVNAMGCDHCRKECSICWAKVEDCEDRDFYALHHGDGWVETITVPAKGKRPEVVVYLISVDLSDEGVASYALIQD